MNKITIQALFDLDRTIARDLLAAAVYPWDVLDGLRTYICTLGPTLPADRFSQIAPDVWAANSAKIAPTASISGPCIIDEDAEIRHCAFIRGSAIVGRGAVVGNSTELKNCILFDGAQVPHFNYVGDSILGYRAHMGAGAVTSNVKGNHTNVTVYAEDGAIETGRRKLGAMLGDEAEIGCGSVLNPGTVIGRRTQVYPLVSVRGIIGADCICKAAGCVVSREARQG